MKVCGAFLCPCMVLKFVCSCSHPNLAAFSFVRQGRIPIAIGTVVPMMWEVRPDLWDSSFSASSTIFSPIPQWPERVCRESRGIVRGITVSGFCGSIGKVVFLNKKRQFYRLLNIAAPIVAII